MKMNTDYAVPLDRNREMLAYYRERLEEEFPGRYVIFGHIGDAHVHVNMFCEPADPARPWPAEGIRAQGGGIGRHRLGRARAWASARRTCWSCNTRRSIWRPCAR